MTKRAGYTYDRILDIMVCGKLSKAQRNDPSRNSWLHFPEAGTNNYYSYQFYPDLKQIWASPPGSFTEKQYLPLSRATTPVPDNKEYVVLCVKTDWIYDHEAIDQVKICLNWLQKSNGPAKIKINCHGLTDGRISMAGSCAKKNRVNGESIADWLFANGLESPQVDDIVIDATRMDTGWASRSNATQCPSCKMIMSQGQKTVHCRACGQVNHYSCTVPSMIRGSLKTTRMERWFSLSDRNNSIVRDQVCKNCRRLKIGSISPRPLTGAERDANETEALRSTYNGVINIGMWVCYGGVTEAGKPEINPNDDSAIQGSLAHRIALRLRERGVTGIEVTGRTDITQQAQVQNPDGSANPYYKLVQNGNKIIKKRVFS